MSALALDPFASLSQVQRQLAVLFESAGSTTSMLDARILLCAALKIDHVDLLRDADRPIGAEAVAKILKLAERRIRHEPVSRILGHREFFGLDLCVTPAVLDPRADTETVVEAVIAAITARHNDVLRILDLGTGSGALLCALLTHFPSAFGVGIDISEAACKVAAKNLVALGLARRGTIVCAQWAEALRGASPKPAFPSSAEAPLRAGGQESHAKIMNGIDSQGLVRDLSEKPASTFSHPGSSPADTSSSKAGAVPFDIVVSNPPYIAQADIASLDRAVRDYDPPLALDGGADGFFSYRALIPELPRLLAKNGIAVFEVGHGQAATVAALLEAEGFSVTARRDLAGIERAVVAVPNEAGRPACEQNRAAL